MAVTWPTTPRRPYPAAPTELLELPDSDDALAAFPSERDPRPRSRGAVHATRRSGVALRVAPLSWAVVGGLVAVLLLGALSVAAIGLLASDARGVPQSAAPVVEARR